MRFLNISNEQIIGISLAELIFLLFMLVTLYSTIKVEDKEIGKEVETDNQSVVVDNASQKKWSEATEELGKTIIQINDIFDNLSISSIKLDEFNTKLVNMEQIRKSFILISKMAEEIQNKHNGLKYLTEKWKAENEELRAENEELRAENTKLEEINARLAKELKKRGLGWPPCLEDKNGKIEYLFQVDIYDDDMYFIQLWPKYREKVIDEFPLIRKLAGKVRKMNDVDKPGEQLLEWSKKNQCRHFIRLKDNTTKLNKYKNTRQKLENYFYKFEIK